MLSNSKKDSRRLRIAYALAIKLHALALPSVHCALHANTRGLLDEVALDECLELGDEASKAHVRQLQQQPSHLHCLTGGGSVPHHAQPGAQGSRRSAAQGDSLFLSLLFADRPLQETRSFSWTYAKGAG